MKHHTRITYEDLHKKLSERKLNEVDFFPLYNYLSFQEYVLVQACRIVYVKNKDQDTFRLPWNILSHACKVDRKLKYRLRKSLQDKKIIIKVGDKVYKWNKQGLDYYLCDTLTKELNKSPKPQTERVVFGKPIDDPMFKDLKI